MLELDNVRDHKALGLSDERIVEMYRTMLLARRLDERMFALNRQGRAPFVVSVAGHEATQVAAAFAIDPSIDWSMPYYRDTAYALALGFTPEDVFLGVFSKETDPCSGGRQLPNHWSSRKLNVFTQSSVIATQYPQACGIAHEIKTSGRPGVVVVSGGEGSTSEGDWHEAMNFASIRKLPMVFLIENNLYAISVPVAEEVAGGLAIKGQGYDMPGIEVDGNNALEVYGTMAAAVERARNGAGPTIIEAKTYRYYAHTSDDDDRLYRSAEEVELWRRKDPISVLRQYLVESRLLDEATEESIDTEVTQAVADGVKAAEVAPDPTDALINVYANPITPTEAVTEPEPTIEGETVNIITAINRSLHDVMDAFPDTAVFGEDVAGTKGGVFKATVGLTDRFGEDRCFNMPLAEALIVGVGIGKAAAGGRPIAEIQFADYIHPAFDQIVSEASRISYRSAGTWNCQLVIRVPYGGGIQGSLYHSQSIEAYYSHVPGLKVVVPSTPADVKGLLWSAVEDPDPVLFLEPKKLYRLAKGPYPEGEHKVPLGKAAVRRTGDDVTVIAYGSMAHFALEAAERVAEDGVDTHVIDLRSLKPLDWPTIEAAVQRNGKVLIVHEDNEFGGYGAEIAAQISAKAFEWLDAPVERYCTPDVPTFPYASSLENQVLPNTAGIADRLRVLAAK